MNTSEWIALRSRLEQVLDSAMKERKRRPAWMNGEPEWVVYERAQMLKAVNNERARLGLPSVDLADVRRVESCAAGHSDYWRKFSLYCAELVVGT